ncbi:chromosome condensation regulator RCC1 [Vibrio sp. STUT-A11]|uniref:RCC1 domain-containing protein n=1 Tax=Vibrio sp. STUT-A11 TaxID=2976236 RepID=UPI00222F4CD6|nr:chromosome condensation regulator RCC1 [Vibrio sp. STUT-A11]
MKLTKTLLAVLVTALVGCDSNDESTAANTGPETQLTKSWDAHSTYSSMTTISGTSSDTDGVESVTVSVNGEIQDADFDGQNFSLAVRLVPGLNSYTVLATDSLGNQTSLTDQVYFGHQVSAGGAHSGAILEGKLWTWGRNNKGQTGHGYISTLDEDNHPTTPTELAVTSEEQAVSFVSLAFNQNASIALDSTGQVWAWGDGDGGQLGLGEDDDVLSEDDVLSPQKISSLENIISVARGYDHTVVLDDLGQVYTFGENDKGQLGNNSIEDSDFPVKVEISDIIQIEAGSDSTYALDINGNLYGWGQNSNGQLGQGQDNIDDILIPTLIDFPEKITSFAAGKAHVIAIGESGQLYGWGLNASNQLGNDEDESWPRELYEATVLPWVEDGVMAWANGNQSFVERSDGQIYPWGNNGMGTLGLETDESPVAPTVAITDLSSVLDIGAGALHTVALRFDSVVFTWGWSFEGSLGIPDPINAWGYSLPQKVK